MVQVTIEQAQQTLDSLITDALNGEDVCIKQGDAPAVRLTPIHPGQSLQVRGDPRIPGLAKGLIKIESGFDDPLEDFKEYME